MADYIDTPKPGDPVRAGWAEDVAQLLRSQRLTAGPGLRVVATPAGTTIMLAPGAGDNVVDEPRAYELRWRLNRSTQVVELACYVGDPAAIYLRNGVAVQMRDSLDAAILPDADGWITIAGPTTSSNHYIIASAHGCIYGTEAGARWDITAATSYPDESNEATAHTQAVLIGRIIDGHIHQIHTGVISTAYQPPPQWQCTIEADRDGDPALFVGSGRLAWGGTHNATWPGRQIALDMMPGQKRFVLWVTRCAPIPHEACLDAVPGCAEITAKDPTAFVPDVGAVEVHASAARQAGWTDAHLLAVIERGEDGAYAIDQVQVAEIAVHAVVYPGETPAAPTPSEAPPTTCAGGTLAPFPSDIDKTSIPWPDHNVSWGDGGTGRFPSKVAACW